MTRTAEQLSDLISATRIRLRRHSPFFAALALFVDVRFTKEVPIAATDGRLLFFHPKGYGDLEPAERDAVFLHELLHAALLHPSRRGVREPELFNIAADIVVNGMVAAEESVALPRGAIRHARLEHLSVEEIYELLQKKFKKKQPKLPLADLLKPGSMGSGTEQEGGEDGEKGEGKEGVDGSSHDPAGELHDLHDRSALEAHWKQAIQQARVMASSQGQGSLPAGMQRHLGEIAEPQIDWRSQLWRYLVRTPTDFSGFDRRFLHRGLYLDHLEGESVQVFVCIDTSGSIDDEQMSLFIGEVSGILSSYPMLDCRLWYADADCYGPYTIGGIREIPRPEGGGGTDFNPFFKAAMEAWSGDQEAICVYLTDGYGEFPEEAPQLPVLWVIVPGGLPSEDIPYGEICRLI
ncbi:MAG: VWA-like domain-containing protein [Synechococcaceae cyanobacterium]|nr:VWA-like domain-containing protein [Synechococcaceae cyanobacterium]